MASTTESQQATPPPANPESGPTTDTPTKPMHSLVLDAGPLIKNDPPVSTLLSQAHELYTIPSVIETEIRDAATRARVETTLAPFLKLRDPRPESVRFVREFARRTGDLGVLSKPDIALVALAYELECERNGGDWRLRRVPGQKGLNGRAPAKAEDAKADEPADAENKPEKEGDGQNSAEDAPLETGVADKSQDESQFQTEPVVPQEEVSHQLNSLSLEGAEASTQAAASEERVPTMETTKQAQPQNQAPEAANGQVEGNGDAEDDDEDEEGWITPSNLKKHQEKDQYAAPQQPIQRFLQVALLTSDYAMQNVALRMNLNLVSPRLARVTRVKTWALRCHGCFQVTRDHKSGEKRQFCPRCGQATLTRVSVSTDQATGAFTLHLKQNFQWNNRGNVYSVPKPTHGSASGKLQAGARGGGGKNGWGRDLILAEDQKEYVRQKDEQRRAAAGGRDLMDEDYLPSILSGDRKGGGPGRIKVGAGRSVNSRKRR
ncbi:hypothetical protein DL766_004956 [Monosporascus sp. MC13-8B]|uniref:20S-pre-rRNA D-site endonuclease NOB1 n=1 Tax=Monosporascus cannonballus TaxID=155416 RepID=A0ABY0H6U0_9PEZI|nr:hypothetical protein DL762_006379 [Monosporascus cannonballus]RYO97012.1 hypothetical protein DL763_002949 [Monosporascus cannonballus]RYP30284.1 hypothetical protein DL766_004956 [Monosporascus sp. MC13-8B]